MTAFEASSARIASPHTEQLAEPVGAALATTDKSREISTRWAALLQTFGSLVWIPQAVLVSVAVGNIASGAKAEVAILPAAGIFVLGALRAILERAGTRRAYDAARNRLSDLRQQASHAVARQSPLDASRPSSGHVASTLAEQAEAIVPYLARFEPLRLKSMVVPLVILACILPLSWAAALVLLVAAPLIPIFMALIGWRAKEASENQLAEMGGMNAYLLDRLRGLATIRAFDAVDRTALQLRANAETLRERTMAVLRIAFLSSAVLELFSALGVAMVAVYVGFHFLGQLDFGAWGGSLSLSQGLFILLLAPAFFEPLRELSSVWHDRAAGQAGLKALQDLSSSQTAIVGAVESTVPEVIDEALSVSIDGLCFTYSGNETPVLDRFTLVIAPGEHVAIMAPSGGGKSTLLALLAGLAPASAGSIRIGGEPLNAATAARLRAHIGWLGQPPHIFAGTIESNVSLDRPGVGKQDVAGALEIARMTELTDHRGSSPIGENGVGLSGGEALRLAIARAAAGHPRGLLLADEPTAHLDSGTAEEVSERLLAIAAGSTLIVATHDPRLAARMNRIVTFEAPARDTAS
ncbi:MAG: thiol reductant ABC exporter subunit CydD [Rhizobiaceae bacterium]|nr:thiol reductant ABC exporter subunit CydD [Rhizobiaceae bacterium]